jgi:hypothetical protein
LKVRWIAEPRALAYPQVEVAAGDEVDVDDATASSLIEQGLAEFADPSKEKK